MTWEPAWGRWPKSRQTWCERGGGEGREWTDKYWQIRICKRKCWGNQRKNYSSSWSKKATEVLNRDSRHRVGRTQERQEVSFRLLLSPLVSPGSSEWIFSFLQLFNIESVEFSWNPLNSVGTGCNLLEGLCAAVHCLANVLFFFFPHLSLLPSELSSFIFLTFFFDFLLLSQTITPLNGLPEPEYKAMEEYPRFQCQELFN